MKDITELSNRELFDEWAAYDEFLSGRLRERPRQDTRAAHYAAEFARRLAEQGTPDGFQCVLTSDPYADGSIIRRYVRVEPPKPRFYVECEFGPVWVVYDRLRTAGALGDEVVAECRNPRDAEAFCAMKNAQAEA